MGRPRTATAGEQIRRTWKPIDWAVGSLAAANLALEPLAYAKAKKYLLCNRHKTTANYGVPCTGLSRRRLGVAVVEQPCHLSSR